MTHGITHYAPAGVGRPPAAAGLVLILILAVGPPAGAQSIAALDTGEKVYESACAACHGPDGRGAPQTAVASTVRMPSTG
jgi:mono/diheme cytochrome c family protein